MPIGQTVATVHGDGEIPVCESEFFSLPVNTIRVWKSGLKKSSAGEGNGFCNAKFFHHDGSEFDLADYFLKVDCLFFLRCGIFKVHEISPFWRDFVGTRHVIRSLELACWVLFLFSVGLNPSQVVTIFLFAVFYLIT